MTFGSQRHVPPCSATLAGASLPVFFECPYLDVILTPSLSWTPHAQHLESRGNRLFAQCVAWCKSERLPLRFASTLFTSYVAGISWGSQFLVSSPPALRLRNSALRRWGRFLLGWPPGSPIAPVFLELGWPDAEHLAISRLLSLFGRVHVVPSGDRCPLPAVIFNLASAVPSVLTYAVPLILPFREALVSALVPPLTVSTPGFVHASLLAWTSLSFRGCAQERRPSPCLTWIFVCCLSTKVPTTLSTAVPPCLHMLVCGGSLDPCPGGRAVRHLGHSLSCVFCDAPQVDLAHCLSSCLAFSDLREQWCRRVSVPLDAAAQWACDPWVFNPSSSHNSDATIVAHISFVGQVCERFLSLLSIISFPVRGSPAACCGFSCFHLLPALLPAFPVRDSPASWVFFLFFVTCFQLCFQPFPSVAPQ